MLRQSLTSQQFEFFSVDDQWYDEQGLGHDAELEMSPKPIKNGSLRDL